MPAVFRGISILGTVAMLWVGGHLVLQNVGTAGWHWTTDLLHGVEHLLEAAGPVIVWIGETFVSAIVGLILGLVIVGVIMLIGRIRGTDHAHAGDRFALERAAGLVGVDHRIGRGQHGAGQVVVGHQHREAERLRFGHAVHAGDAVVHGDEQVGAALLHAAGDAGGEAVAVGHAVGHQVVHLARAQQPQAAHRHGAGGGPVAVVVGHDDDAPVKAEVPVYVMFVTDGSTSDKPLTERQLRWASREPIFWQFMGIGKGRKSKSKALANFADSDFPFLEKLDELDGRLIDNADFFSVASPDEHSDAQLYDLLMTEYPQWVREAGQRGLLRG